VNIHPSKQLLFPNPLFLTSLILIRSVVVPSENAKKCGETACSEQRSLIQKQLLEGTPGEEEKRREGKKTEVL